MANFTPVLGDYTELKPFRFWCQKVLPLVYDDSLSYYELLCKVVDYLNKTMEDVDTLHTDVENLHQAYVLLQGYVNDYFDNLDVQQEINNKLDVMAQDGSLSALISPFIPDIVSAWLAEHITPTTPVIDDSLTVRGAGADAYVTGANIHSTLAFPTNEGSKIVVNQTNHTLTLRANSSYVWDGGTVITSVDKVYDNYSDLYSITKVFIDSITEELVFKATSDTTPINKNLGFIGFLIRSSYSFINVTNAITPSSANLCKKLGIDNTLSVIGMCADAFSVGANVHSSLAFPTNEDSKIVVDQINHTLTLRANSSYVWDGDAVITSVDKVYDNYSDLYSITKVFIDSVTEELVFKATSDTTPINKNLGFIGFLIRSSYSFINVTNAITPTVANIIRENEAQKPSLAIFNGLISICMCGNDVIIDCYNFRTVDLIDNTYSSGTDNTFVLDGTYTLRYIEFKNNSFNLNATLTRYAIAMYYNGMITPLIDGIIVGRRLPSNGYVRNGHLYHINLEKYLIDGYIGYDSPNEFKYGKKYYALTNGNHFVYAKTNNSTNLPKPINIQLNSTNINNKKVLFIGDSFVARGYIQHYINEFNNTISFIGTKTTQNYDYKSEGVSGSRLYYFTDPSTSPFYFNGGLNFAQYLSTNGLDAPDFVIINSAINHVNYVTDGTSYLQNLVALVNMIKSYNTNIKIYVTLGANYALELGSVYGIPNNRFDTVLRCIYSVYDSSLAGITVIPIFTALDDELDYNYETVNYFDSTTSVLSDCVHPNMLTGFKKIAEQIYNYLGI